MATHPSNYGKWSCCSKMSGFLWSFYIRPYILCREKFANSNLYCGRPDNILSGWFSNAYCKYKSARFVFMEYAGDNTGDYCYNGRELYSNRLGHSESLFKCYFGSKSCNSKPIADRDGYGKWRTDVFL